MLLEIYLFLLGCGILFTTLAFIRKDVAFFAFFACIFFAACSVISFDIEKTYCEIDSAAWSCTQDRYTESSLGFLWGGLGLIMLVYGIFMAVWKGSEEMEAAVDRT